MDETTVTIVTGRKTTFYSLCKKCNYWVNLCTWNRQM